MAPSRSVASDGGVTFPLSFAQERFWFLEQLEPGDPSHHVPGASRLRGRLDVDVLRHAVQVVVDRHEMLRTTFRILNGQPKRPKIAGPCLEHPWQWRITAPAFTILTEIPSA